MIQLMISHDIDGHGPSKEICVVERGHEMHRPSSNDDGGEEQDHVVVVRQREPIVWNCNETL